MKYFGCIEKDFLKNKSEKEIGDFLVENKLFEVKFEAKGNSSDIKDGILELRYNPTEAIVEPTKELVDDFYSYIIDMYKHEINSDKFVFFNMFNDEIYGLLFNKQKKIALNHFLNIFNEKHINVVNFLELTTSDKGVNHTHTGGKLKLLYGQYNAYKRNLIEEIKVNQYLEGNADFFSKVNLFTKYPNIIKTISFEICLQILVELNDRFQFEEDVYFTQIRFDKENFKKYNNIFKTLESYQFTNNKIKSFVADQKAQIASLYQVLIDEKLIFEHKENFMKFLKKEYDLTLTKIISYDKKINYTHDERVTLFSAEWSNLTSEKEQN